jgi:hypothetical protein
LASGNTKSITLPISGVFIALGSRSLDLAIEFVGHWEDLTGSLFADVVLAKHPHVSVDQSEGCIPASFFDEDGSPHSIPFPRSSITQKMFPKFIPKIRDTLPAKPSDLLWLLEQFLVDEFPSGGELDPVSVSEHPTYSVYAKLMNFASRPKYQHHPHNDTLKAMAHISEQGVDDRRVPWNILLVSLELLRPGSAAKKKNLKRTLPDGSKIETSRLVRTMSAGPAASDIIAPTKIPDLVEAAEEVGEVEDITDNEEDDGDSNDSDGMDDDSDGMDDDSDGMDDDSDGMDDDGDRMEWTSSKGIKRKHNDDDDDDTGGQSSSASKPARQKLERRNTVGGRAR